jgi:glycosyltransferase involved in cell wall biosynthesis
MNIAHIIPGSGGSFYCGNCLRDSKLFQALRQQGHHAIKIPMYLPLFSNDDANNGEVPVFYGAISIYLKQLFPAFRHAPAWVDKLLNTKPMLRFAAHMANSTRAKGLEEMTVSMLMGEHGKQKEELDKMAQWLADHYKADVIHISNALLLGLAHKLKEKLNVPLVCSLQDEDVWVDVMRPGFINQVWELMQEKAADIDLFISVSNYYTQFMKEKLKLPDEKISTLHLGVDPLDYHFINATEKKRNIGFLSRMCHENGMDILVDAFIRLKSMPGYEDVSLLLTGGHTADDTSFIREQKEKIKKAGLRDAVVFLDNFGQDERRSFFDQLMLLSVPVRHGEAFGIYLTEAMASGIPVVQPALGAFPEIVEKSGGGIIYPDNTAQCLSGALKSLLDNREEVHLLSRQARKSIENEFNINELSKQMTGLYETAIKNKEDADKGREPVQSI